MKELRVAMANLMQEAVELCKELWDATETSSVRTCEVLVRIDE